MNTALMSALAGLDSAEVRRDPATNFHVPNFHVLLQGFSQSSRRVSRISLPER